VPASPDRPKVRREEIAADVRRRIAGGEYEGGLVARSEQELGDRYEVHRLTARQVVAQLRSEGLIETRRGQGIYVTPWRPIPRNSPGRLSADQWTEGRAIWDVDLDGRPYEVRDIQIEQLPASNDVASSLGLAQGALVWRRARRYFVDGHPVQYAESYLPAGLVEGSRITQIDTGPGGIHARLRELGHEPVRHREELKPRIPTAEDRERLDLTRDTPVLDIVRVSWDAEGTAVERVEMLLDGSRYVLGYDF
jgi:GntR family transcriptional regulator